MRSSPGIAAGTPGEWMSTPNAVVAVTGVPGDAAGVQCSRAENAGDGEVLDPVVDAGDVDAA